MRLPLKTQYACQVMAQLAKTHGDEGVRRVEELAVAESLSANYLVQILTKLRPAGLVISKRGKQGGYRLARDPESITLAEIACAMEGEPLIETGPGNDGMSSAKVGAAWARANEVLFEALDGIALSELIADDRAGRAEDWVI